MLQRLIGALTRLFRKCAELAGIFATKFHGAGPDPRLMKGLAHQKAGDLIAAEQCYTEVLRYSPEHPDALHLLSTVAQRRGALDQAEEWVRRALKVSPARAEYCNTLATVLTDMGCHSEALEILRLGLKASPDALRLRTNLLFLLQLLPGVTRELLLAEHIEWAKWHVKSNPAQDTEPVRFQVAAIGKPAERLRIGYISADFCSHPVGRIMSVVLPKHDSESHEIVCYDNGSRRDDVNTILRKNCEKWIEIHDYDDNKLVQRIRADRLDVLVDLSGHTRGGRLTALGRKPAAVQVEWLGYLSTTGVAAMDWRLTDRRTDPEPHAQGWHVERLWYLPDCLWPWMMWADADRLDVVEPPSVQNKFITFGSFNTFRKINSRVIATWADLLNELPEARLRIYGAPAGRAIELVYDQFEAAGINADRIDLFASVEYAKYLHAYREIDIALDPFPYCGGATTCESLWMGVPVITLAGEGGFSRTGAGLLGAIGLDEYIAATTVDYVRIAARLAQDSERLSELRRTLRERVSRSPMADAEGFVRNLEKAYRGMWRHFVLSHPDNASFAGNSGLAR